MSNVYVVEDEGKRCSNWDTGTRIYTRLNNAVKLADRYQNSNRQVVEYELVPTGRVFDKKGELIV